MRRINRNRLHTRSVLEKRTINNQSRQDRYLGAPGPADYSSNVYTLTKVLSDKFKRGYRGEFGTRQARFKTSTDNSSTIPGPGQYSNLPSKEICASTSYIAQSKREDSFHKQS
jgi:hypothetical protein